MYDYNLMNKILYLIIIKIYLTASFFLFFWFCFTFI